MLTTIVQLAPTPLAPAPARFAPAPVRAPLPLRFAPSPLRFAPAPVQARPAPQPIQAKFLYISHANISATTNSMFKGQNMLRIFETS